MLPWCQSVTSALTSGTLQQQKEMAHNLWFDKHFDRERNERVFREHSSTQEIYSSEDILSCFYLPRENRLN